MDSNLKMEKMQVEGTDKYIGGIYYYVPNEKASILFQLPFKNISVLRIKMNIKIIIKGC